MNLFTYGTLMVPEIMHQVAGCVLDSIEVTLAGYVRYGVQGEQYPGLAQKEGCSVDGVLYLDVDAEALKRLDIFEGRMYSRDAVKVVQKDGQGQLDAMVYVFKPEYAHLLTGEAWDFLGFLQRGRKIFENEYEGYGELQR